MTTRRNLNGRSTSTTQPDSSIHFPSNARTLATIMQLISMHPLANPLIKKGQDEEARQLSASSSLLDCRDFFESVVVLFSPIAKLQAKHIFCIFKHTLLTCKHQRTAHPQSKVVRSLSFDESCLRYIFNTFLWPSLALQHKDKATEHSNQHNGGRPKAYPQRLYLPTGITSSRRASRTASEACE